MRRRYVMRLTFNSPTAAFAFLPSAAADDAGSTQGLPSVYIVTKK